jgi:hypothetical protein
MLLCSGGSSGAAVVSPLMVAFLGAGSGWPVRVRSLGGVGRAEARVDAVFPTARTMRRATSHPPHQSLSPP